MYFPILCSYIFPWFSHRFVRIISQLRPVPCGRASTSGHARDARPLGGTNRCCEGLSYLRILRVRGSWQLQIPRQQFFFKKKSIKKQTMIFSNVWSVCRSGCNPLETGGQQPNLATVKQCDAIEWPKPLPSESGKMMINIDKPLGFEGFQTHFQRHFMPRHASPFPTCRAVKGDSNNLNLTVMTLAPWLYVWCVCGKKTCVCLYILYNIGCQVHSMHHGSQHSNSWPCRGYLPLREGIHALDGATVTQPPRERLLQLTLLGGTGLRGLATPRSSHW